MKERNGIPMIGFGTSGLGAKAHESIGIALEVGYRHLDTAQSYGTEDVIGRVLKEAGTPRDAVFLTTKIADSNLGKDRFMPSLRQSLDRLGVDHVDLLLIHWPSHRDAVPFADYMEALARAKADGFARLIGVSNFTTALLAKAVAIVGPGEIVTDQVEMHPHLHNRSVLDWCDRHGIAVTAYMPIARGRVLADPAIADIARRIGLAPAVVVLAWLIQLGVIVIPASTSRAHIEANLGAANVRLDEAAMAAMAGTDRRHRIINPTKSPDWD